MSKLKSFSVQDLLKYMHVNTDGRILWKERCFDAGWSQQRVAAVLKFNKYCAGNFADGVIDSYGYRIVSLNNIKLKAHHAVWAIHFGLEPKGNIDHIDGDPANNKIENLREVDQQTNCMNRAIQSNNKSGATGVRWHKKSSKWCASIKKDGVSTHIGLFTKIEDAIMARKKAEFNFGFHENHGRAGLLRLPKGK